MIIFASCAIIISKVSLPTADHRIISTSSSLKQTSNYTRMDAAKALLVDHNVQAYFLVLGLAVHRCIKIYYGKITDGTNIKRQDNAKPSILPLLLSVSIIGITWYLILRFILTNLHSCTSYFDDAYKDVLRAGHYFTSTQLLTWAIVAVVWVASAGHVERDVVFLVFGFLGAMGAAFAVWVPTLYHRCASRKKRLAFVDTDCVPITYVITSAIAFISILKLQPCDPTQQECTPEEGFGAFHLNFRQWLQCLHVILVAPALVSLVLPTNALPRVPSSLLFGALVVASATWHLRQIKEGAKYIIPLTDCQISIATDLVCCSCITLYVIYKDTITQSKSQGMNISDGGAAKAFTRMCLGAVIMPIISPAAVLAAHLCLNRFGKTYSYFIACMQQKVASKLRSSDVKKRGDDTKNTMWCNLGLWTRDECGYNEACENLAEALGKLANLSSLDAVLCCGCGSIDEAKYYKNQFGLRHITGIDPNLAEARTTDMNDFNIRTIRAGVEDLRIDKSAAPLFPPQMFDKILALDNVYHYESKASFFRDCLEMLPAGGKVAISDIVLRQNNKDTQTWVKFALRSMGVSTNCLWSVEDYTNKLASLGFDRNVKIELVGTSVFKGWSFLPACLLQYLEYALVVARKPEAENPSKEKKKRIAVIGSGLAGLSTAYYLLSSNDLILTSMRRMQIALV
jgi:cyclopropane fatty-acyl-phospholipid synthase-like methyltransferase